MGNASFIAVSKDVHRGFSIYKKDLEQNLRILEKTRATRNLTAEETELHKRMLQNLNDLERYITERLSAPPAPKKRVVKPKL